MILVLIRHAHRDTTDRAADNGLSEKGRGQAAALLRHFGRAFSGQESVRVLSSPKRRCLETVRGIAAQAGCELEESVELLEQGAEESGAELRARARRFVARWQEGRVATDVLIVCSHGDWLPVALEAATGARAQLKKGAWAEISCESGEKPRLVWLIQGFKQF